MLKYEHIQPGSHIRAYDFKPSEGREDLYVEGEVIEHVNITGFKALKIVCDFDSGAGENPEYSRVGMEVYVPMECTHDYDERVTVLTDHKVNALAV